MRRYASPFFFPERRQEENEEWDGHKAKKLYEKNLKKALQSGKASVIIFEHFARRRTLSRVAVQLGGEVETSGGKN